MSMFEVFLWGLFGGLAGEGLGWIELARSKELPEYVKKKFYWFAALVLGVVGGLLALAYFKSEPGHSAILYVNIGASAPLIVRGFARLREPGGRDK
jgi:hypothetical protein